MDFTNTRRGRACRIKFALASANRSGGGIVWDRVPLSRRLTGVHPPLDSSLIYDELATLTNLGLSDTTSF